jgi:hypothetical protein
VRSQAFRLNHGYRESEDSMRRRLMAIFILCCGFVAGADRVWADGGCVVEKRVADDMHDIGATLAYRLIGTRLQDFVTEKINLPRSLTPQDITIAHVWKLDRDVAEIVVFDRKGCFLAQGFASMDDLLVSIEGNAI